MALLEDALKGDVVTLAVAGAAAVALPALFPGLAPPLRSLLRLGVSLFLESEAEAEGEFVESLVQSTVNGLLGVLGAPASEADRREAVHSHIRHFEKRARARASRFGWNEQDRAARYRRQVASLKRAISTVRRERPNTARPLLDHATRTITEDW